MVTQTSKNTDTKRTRRQKDRKELLKKSRNAVKRVEGMDFQIWLCITMVYVVFVAIVSGMVKVWLPDILFIGKLPIDPQYGMFALMIALWIPISLLLKALLVKY